MHANTLTFEAIGTHWQIDIMQEISADDLRKFHSLILACIDEFDKTYSRFRPDSLVTEISKQEGTFTLPDDAELLFFLYRRIYDLTHGKVTPLIGNALEEAGYDADYSFVPKIIHTPPVWDDAIEYTHPLLKMKQKAMLDFGAAGKGYLVDILGELLHELGVTHFTIDAGGDILHASPDDIPIRIGLEHPEDSSKVIGVVEIANQSICGSAGNRRKWENFHHILDPDTLASPQEVLATWVVADNAIVADALATCLFFVSPEDLLRDFSFEYVILLQDYSLVHSPRLQSEFY